MVDVNKFIQYLKLDLNSTSQVDSTPNGNDASVTGATFITGGKINGAYNYDGNDYINMGNMLSSPTKMSFCAWVEPDSPTTLTGVIFAYRDEGTQLLQLTSQSDGSLRLQIRTSTSSLISVNYSPSSWSEYNHVGFSFDRTTNEYRLYWNGVNVASNTNSLSGTLDSSIITLGANNTGVYGTFYKGKIDEPGFCDDILSPTDFEEIYNSGDGIQYPFGEGGAKNAIFLGGSM